eukprot:CAMPEP_0202395856 /NCGR_PEP_ID=MMETSP1127-20130417/94190_1 /ASSEMBLY_ACC=CAM_ASM_000462 /TAXON_ID=3047 /ORGANISM="Dunaliella tertiolecta, Strain CCMP1320" /LENGTH=38 /DNA_ID= /DNA_START= /DNA_END= /DNA_ORIENTATION=
MRDLAEATQRPPLVQLDVLHALNGKAHVSGQHVHLWVI